MILGGISMVREEQREGPQLRHYDVRRRNSMCARRPVLVMTLAVVLLGAPMLTAVSAQQREPGIGVATVGSQKRWYTNEQAERGGEEYATHCARCHGVQLDGVIGVTPPLAGPAFLDRWSGKSVDTLFHFVTAMMPLDMPSVLDEATYADIIAYILEQNGLKPGSDELRADRYRLGKLVIPSVETLLEAEEH